MAEEEKKEQPKKPEETPEMKARHAYAKAMQSIGEIHQKLHEMDHLMGANGPVVLSQKQKADLRNKLAVAITAVKQSLDGYLGTI